MPPTPKKATRAYTTTAGERVTKFNDGTQNRVPVNPVPASVNPPVDLASGIPATVATAPASTLQTPPITPPTEVANETKSFGQEYLSGLQGEAQKRLDQAQAPITEGERSIREVMGLLNTEADTRTKLEETRGVTGIEEQMRRSEQSIAQQIAAIDDFDDSTVFNTEEMRIEGSKRDVTKATFGAQSAEYNLKRAIQRRGQASQLRATVAANAALQGNLELATEQVDKALKSIYDPIRQDLAMEQFFLQRNDKRFDAAQKEVSDLRLKEIDRQFEEIDRATMSVDSAVASGYAGADDIKKMTALSGDPTAQRAYAQSIIAKGAIQERLLNEAAQRSTISNNDLNRRKALMELALAGDPEAIAELNFDPGEPMRIQETAKEKIATTNELNRLDGVMGDIENILGNKVGLTTSSGQLRNATFSGLIGGQIINQQEDRNKFEQVVGTLPVVGNFVNAVSARNSKDDFLATANRLLTDKGFEALIDINERVRLTPITEMEVNLAFASANALNSAAKRDPETNRLVGFRMSEERVQEEFAKLYTATLNVQSEVAAISELGYDGYLQLLELQRQVQ
jgi:hypothetical protein